MNLQEIFDAAAEALAGIGEELQEIINSLLGGPADYIDADYWPLDEDPVFRDDGRDVWPDNLRRMLERVKGRYRARRAAPDRKGPELRGPAIISMSGRRSGPKKAKSH